MLLYLVRRVCGWWCVQQHHPRKWTVRHIFQVFFISIILISLLVALIIYLPSFNDDNEKDNSLTASAAAVGHVVEDKVSAILKLEERMNRLKLLPLSEAPVVHISSAEVADQRRLLAEEQRLVAFEAKGGWAKCSMYNCFDIHRCGGGRRRSQSQHQQTLLSVYIYPIEKFVVDGRPLLMGDGEESAVGISREYYEFLDAIRKSPYYVSNPEDACLFVPSIDTFGAKSTTFLKDLETTLHSLPFWRGSGQNHLLVSMFPGNAALLTLNTEAIIASSAFSKDSYRMGFHVPIISYSPFGAAAAARGTTSSSSHNNRSLLLQQSPTNHNRLRNVLAISGQGLLPPAYLEDSSNGGRVLVLDYCHSSPPPVSYSTRCRGSQVYPYPDILRTVDFCVIVKDLSGPALWDAMSVGCVPVIIADSQSRLPFDDVVDWKMNALILYEAQIPHLSSILESVSEKRRERLRSQVNFTFATYFSSVSAITNTLLRVLNDRVFSHAAPPPLRTWNNNHQKQQQKETKGCSWFGVTPLFNPVIMSPAGASRGGVGGFTAVILAYERVPSLFQVIETIAAVPSLAKVIVVWNNNALLPPPHSAWPLLSVPLKVIRMDENKMSNRFFPFDEIETEAVFSLDDDIVMLTPDEIQFGFDAWREFSDRIVGFPSRSHVWDNGSRHWKYESEWTNEISMVLTGAAFYHKYWHWAYTYEMPGEVRSWVDSRMNCEDIAMNFLVSARTGKAPIKVTARKKFKCPSCSTNEMLSSDSSHMMERTGCINKFVEVYGGVMPLVGAEFRVDPVLFKAEHLPNRLKLYADTGSL